MSKTFWFNRSTVIYSTSKDHWSHGVALVTGASSAIGAAICRELARKESMQVIGCSRNIEKIEELAKSEKKLDARIYPWKCDVSVESDVQEMFEYIRTQFGSLDLLINNAMININSSLLSGESEDWKRMLEVGIEGMCLTSKAAIHSMMSNCDHPFGHIIQIASFANRKIPLVSKLTECKQSTLFQMYNGVTRMNRALAETLRQELRARKYQIRVSTISPGVVESSSLFRTLAFTPVMEFFNNYNPLDPAEVATAVHFIMKAPYNVTVEDITLEPRAIAV